MGSTMGDAYISHKQEAFAEAYIRAVCATVGYSISKPAIDNDKIDFIVSSREIGSVLTKPKIDLQSKCKMHGLPLENPIPYSIDIDTYNNLRDTKVCNPRVLVLTIVPQNSSLWIEQSEKELALKHCSYWLSLKGMPDTDNISNITVYFPRDNVFAPASLTEMMVKTSNGEDL